MTAQPSTFGRFTQAVRLPFTLFADEQTRVMERLDRMHRSVPDTLPEKRFFKH